MNRVDEAQELHFRELDRQCRRNFGFGLNEVPPMSPWEAQARNKAYQATNSASYLKGRPTFRQRQAIEEYNGIARRYRALADADLQGKIAEIDRQVSKEKAAGKYVDPGISSEWRAVSAISGLLAFISLAIMINSAVSERLLWAILASIFTGAGILLFDIKADDPRVAAPRREQGKIYRYWEIIG